MKNIASNPRPNVNPLALPILALAGRAVLTFRNVEAGTHFTARIRQCRDKKDRKIKLPKYNVEISLLGDHDMGYRYAGMIFTENNEMRIWIARDVQPTDQLAIVFRWMVRAIQNPTLLAGSPSKTDGRIHNRVHLFHEGKCCCCRMPLTHPESVYTGLGPVCLKRKIASMREQNVEIESFFAPVAQ